MQYARLGGSGLVVSRIALGCMSFGSRARRPRVLEEDEAMLFFRRAVEQLDSACAAVDVTLPGERISD